MLSNDEYLYKLKSHISDSIGNLDQNRIKDDEIRWKYIKFEIRQFSVTFSENFSKSLNVERELPEKNLKDFEKPGSSYSGNEDYIACKTKLDNICDKKV